MGTQIDIDRLVNLWLRDGHRDATAKKGGLSKVMQRLKDAVKERQYIPFLNQDQAEHSADLQSSHRNGSSGVYQTSPSSLSSSSSSSSSALALSSSSSSSSSSFSYNRSLSPLSLLPSSLLSSLAS